MGVILIRNQSGTIARITAYRAASESLSCDAPADARRPGLLAVKRQLLAIDCGLELEPFPAHEHQRRQRKRSVTKKPERIAPAAAAAAAFVIVAAAVFTGRVYRD